MTTLAIAAAARDGHAGAWARPVRRRPQYDGTPSVASQRYAMVFSVDHSNAGIFIIVVGGALLALLVLGRRAGRSIAMDIWHRIGIFRWILVAIVIVIILDLSDGLPNQ
ncbi:hypothetical protein FRACA_2230004 [Frankia canadensis]|uniref:Uncharacterized protein n=1 Tax=Frankia canadensis TaxID=1836972 RepID=A0A2I2KR53_9ACTN|nr:hypothetical protein [Frankia canadensis]SNQ48144.1 hypothetical protein FRACA_2230004 [Frankia canadensis]SOU55434.1 hypothetical protein FRACA_2230004 [Frankia canadensis]